MKKMTLRLVSAVLSASIGSSAGLLLTQNVQANSDTDLSADPAVFSLDDDQAHEEGELIVSTRGVELDEISSIEDSVTSIEKLDFPFDEDIYLVKIDSTMDAETIEDLFSSIDGIDFVQYNYTYQVEPDAPAPNHTDDPFFSNYQVEQVWADVAWGLLEVREHSRVRVGIIDMGVDYTHPELEDVVNKDLCYDVFYDEPLSSRGFGYHGTHVAGILAAKNSGSDDELCGIASGYNNDIVELVSYNVIEAGADEARSDIIAKGVTMAVDDGCKVINLSLGGPHHDSLIHRAISYGYDHNTVAVASAGNDNSEEYFSPSDFPEVISVIALDYVFNESDNSKASFSNYGDEKDIAAPGCWIYSCVPGGKYECFSGTSMASPIVAAVAAIILSVSPDLSPREVKNIIQSTADDLYTPGFDKYTAYGKVNAYCALQYATRLGPGLRRTLREDFIWRLYDVILDRQPDDIGYAHWMEELDNGTTGSEIVRCFCLSEELRNKDLEDEAFLYLLYRAIFDREPDDVGYKQWSYFLYYGGSREGLVSHFINSREFANLCADFEIPVGYVFFPEYEANPNVILIIGRAYYYSLFIIPDIDTVHYWCDRLLFRGDTVKDLMMSLFMSEEFKQQNYDDEAYITYLYLAFLWRLPEENEVAFWKEQLRTGYSRDDVLFEFIYSEEFGEICLKKGLVPYNK